MSIKPFAFNDTLLKKNYAPVLHSLIVNNSGKTVSSPMLVILRLALGKVRISPIFQKSSFLHEINYLDLQNLQAGVDELEKLKEYLAPDVPLNDFAALFSDKVFINQNTSFYLRLLNELSNFIFYERKGSHTTAFIYLYRTLEVISIPFPLIYVSKVSDFGNAFEFLRSCTATEKNDKDGGKGELGVFKTFVEKIFENDPIKESTIDIDIIHNPRVPELQELYYKKLKDICSFKGSSIIKEDDCVEFSKLAINYTEMGSLIISIRNRFFHLFNSERHNIQSHEIPHSDEFFQFINNKAAYWLFSIYFEIIKYSLSKIKT